ncbi:universal stress protein [Flavisericum labens]|uniref:universal stress protein n=1 Tax=Flavisericum labens TaxID=3377112 RepID=UPI00387B6529
MSRHILLPTDFSDNAWNATVYALKLFEDEVCTFYFLNSTYIRVSMLSNLSNKLLNTMKDEAFKELADLKNLAETSNANANHDFQIILSTDELEEAVKKVVRQRSIDFVVMGTKGATGAKEYFFGTNTVHIAKTLKICPVLIVPEDYDFIVPSQIAFPTDYNRFYNEIELGPIKELADLYNSKIRVVHIHDNDELNEVQNHNLKALQNALSDYQYSLHWMPNYAKKAVEIHDFVEELNVNILVMVNYKHSFIENILNEPVIKKIGFQTKIPFLVIPE